MIPKDLRKNLNQKKWEKIDLSKYQGKDFFVPLVLAVVGMIFAISIILKGCVDNF